MRGQVENWLLTLLIMFRLALRLVGEDVTELSQSCHGSCQPDCQPAVKPAIPTQQIPPPGDDVSLITSTQDYSQDGCVHPQAHRQATD